ncbi:hypothetical protein WBG83_21740 [Paenibacillus sp. y28]
MKQSAHQADLPFLQLECADELLQLDHGLASGLACRRHPRHQRISVLSPDETDAAAFGGVLAGQGQELGEFTLQQRRLAAAG